MTLKHVTNASKKSDPARKRVHAWGDTCRSGLRRRSFDSTRVRFPLIPASSWGIMSFLRVVRADSIGVVWVAKRMDRRGPVCFLG